MTLWLDSNGNRYIDSTKPAGALALLTAVPRALPATFNVDHKPAPPFVQVSPDQTPALALKGVEHLVDTSANAMALTLPSNPDDGDWVLVVDATGNAGTHNIVVTAGSVTVIGGTIATNNASVLFTFDAVRGTWVGR
jgi:hypothetical protein